MSTALKRAVEDVLVQGERLLTSVEAQQYAMVVGVPFSASLGQHYRHVLDHFICVADGIITGRIDYDRRERNRELEINVDAALRCTSELLSIFSALTDEDFRRPCIVRYTVGYREEDAQDFESDFAREIAYCVSHSIHHFAIMRLLCEHFAVKFPAEFGIAPSTLKNRAAHAAQ